ncbi:uncharacterized protein LOC110597508 [Ictidomys tridecemlineatus]
MKPRIRGKGRVSAATRVLQPLPRPRLSPRQELGAAARAAGGAAGGEGALRAHALAAAHRLPTGLPAGPLCRSSPGHRLVSVRPSPHPVSPGAPKRPRGARPSGSQARAPLQPPGSGTPGLRCLNPALPVQRRGQRSSQTPSGRGVGRLAGRAASSASDPGPQPSPAHLTCSTCRRYLSRRGRGDCGRAARGSADSRGSYNNRAITNPPPAHPEELLGQRLNTRVQKESSVLFTQRRPTQGSLNGLMNDVHHKPEITELSSPQCNHPSFSPPPITPKEKNPFIFCSPEIESRHASSHPPPPLGLKRKWHPPVEGVPRRGFIYYHLLIIRRFLETLPPQGSSQGVTVVTVTLAFLALPILSLKTLLRFS